MDKELQLVLSQMNDEKAAEIHGVKVFTGNIARHEVVAFKCGIGKVNSALAAYRVLSELKPDLVINSGVAGGTDESVHIGDVLVADKIAYHDVWCGPGTVYGTADGYSTYFTPRQQYLDAAKAIAGNCNCPVRFGLLCSGDKFISTPEEVREIKSHFPDSLGCDMESASLAQTCALLDVPFLVVRVMSDMPGGGENISEYQNFWSEAPERTFGVVSTLLNNL